MYLYITLRNDSCQIQLYDINKCKFLNHRPWENPVVKCDDLESGHNEIISTVLKNTSYLLISMSLMVICNKFTYLCELITRKHFLNGNEEILPSFRLVRTSISTRIRPLCDANSRHIIPRFNEKLFAQSIYILPVLKTITNSSLNILN